MKRCTLSLVVLACAACRYQPGTGLVQLAGDSLALRRLAGDWTGEYRGPESGRAGTVTFHMTADADSAFGDASLVLPGEGLPVTAANSDGHRLGVRFVAAAGSRVRGSMEPYHNSNCSCTMSTVFAGRLAGDTIRGTFVASRSDGGEQHGTWRVVRVNH